MRRWRGRSYLQHTRYAINMFKSFMILMCVKAILAQKSRDESIGRLVDAMNDTYGFVYEVEPLKTVESHKKIIVRIIQQTTECGYFICDYSKNKEFCKCFRVPKFLYSHDGIFSRETGDEESDIQHR
jgi:hypothetical protein